MLIGATPLASRASPALARIDSLFVVVCGGAGVTLSSFG